MIIVLNEFSFKEVNEKGIMKYGNTDFEKYIDFLKKVGFYDVNYLKLKSERGNFFSVIFVRK